MRLNPLVLSESNWIASLPAAMRGPGTEFDILTFYLAVADALQSDPNPQLISVGAAVHDNYRA